MKTKKIKGRSPRSAHAKRASKQKESQASSLHLQARCILGHVETLSPAQIEAAGRDGVAMCSRCGNATLVRRATSVPAGGDG